jgi:hypothetical protein
VARTFTSGSSEKVDVAVGSLTAFPGFTMAALMRLNVDAATYPVRIATSANATVIGLRVTPTTFGVSVDGAVSATSSFGLTTADGWCLIVATKASGTAIPVVHKYRYATASLTTMSASANRGNPTGIPSYVTFGRLTTTEFLSGDIAAAAIWQRQLSATEVALLPHALSAWISRRPSAMWLFDQASSLTPVLDITGGGANQTAITGTSVASSPAPIAYGHPIILPTRTSPATGSSAATLPALSAAAVGAVGTPYVTGIPQAFGFTTSGTVVTYTGSGDTGPTVVDVLLVNSDNVVTTPAGWTLVEDAVQFQGAYIFAKAGGTTSATIDLGGGVSTDTSVLWVRVANTAGVDTGGVAHTIATGAGTSASATTATLADTNELVLAFAALHNWAGAQPSGITWSTGYLPVVAGGNGSPGSGSAAYGAAAVKVPAGTAAETPSVSWTGATNDRYMLTVAFTAAPPASGETGAAAVTLPALTSAASGTVGATGTAALGLPALTSGGVGTVTAAGAAALGLPALTVAAAGTVGATATAILALPALTGAAAGTAAASAVAALALPALTAAAAGTVTATGASTLTLPALTAAGTGGAGVTGTTTVSLPALTATASGAVVGTGSANLALPALAAAVSGTASGAGTAALSLPPLTAVSSGTASVSGVASITLPVLQAAAVGDVAGATSGGSAVALPTLTAAATGTASTSGSSAAGVPAVTATATGSVTATGTSSVALPALTAGATGSSGTVGAATIGLPSLTAAAAGTASAQGIGAIGLPALVAVAVGAAPITGSSALALPALTADAAGSTPENGVITITLPALTMTGSDQPIYRRRPGRYTTGSIRPRLTAGSVRADYRAGGVDG